MDFLSHILTKSLSISQRKNKNIVTDGKAIQSTYVKCSKLFEVPSLTLS